MQCILLRFINKNKLVKWDICIQPPLTLIYLNKNKCYQLLSVTTYLVNIIHPSASQYLYKYSCSVKASDFIENINEQRAKKRPRNTTEMLWGMLWRCLWARQGDYYQETHGNVTLNTQSPHKNMTVAVSCYGNVIISRERDFNHDKY